MTIPAETNDGEVTSWIPLTAVYTPSSGCESVFRLNGPSLVAFDPGYGLDIDTAVNCAPSAVTTWWEQARLGVGSSGHTAVSILPLTCPDQWTTVATSMKGQSTTQLMCCPSGYYLANGVKGSITGDCASNVFKGMVLTYASTTATATRDWHTETTTLTASSIVGAIAVVGWDLARAVSISTPTLSLSLTLSSSSLATPASTSSSISVPSPTPASNGKLSAATEAGIGLGVALGVIGVLALIFAMLMFRRQNRKASADAGAEATSLSKPTPQHTLTQQQYPIYELPSQSQIEELPDNDARSPLEMDGNIKEGNNESLYTRDRFMGSE